jgi:signal peptidase I
VTDTDESPPSSTPNFEFPTTKPVVVTEKRPTTVRTIVEWVAVIAGAVILALVIKTFLFQAFYIPSESMVTTLEIGDRVLVNKLSYRMGDIDRGDIVVFERPEADESNDGIEDLIKRVIGLPGDQLVIKDGRITINGQLLNEPYLEPGVATQPGPITCSEAEPCVVPDDMVWVMGDNRGSSRDSRWFGPIPDDDVVGRAFFRIWPLNRVGVL